jgi:response regulator NasT
MKTKLRIVVAEDERDMREFVQESLERLGHQVVATCLTGKELIAAAQTTTPDLVVADIRMPEMDGIEAVRTLNRQRPLPVILITAHHDQETLARANSEFIVGYLIKPISEPELKAAIALAMSRFEHMQSLVKESNELRQALEDRKLVERAKGIVMKRLRTDEDDAFRRMRKLASNQNAKLHEVCRGILSAEEVFHSLEN